MSLNDKDKDNDTGGDNDKDGNGQRIEVMKLEVCNSYHIRTHARVGMASGNNSLVYIRERHRPRQMQQATRMTAARPMQGA